MNKDQNFEDLKKALHLLAHALIQEGMENRDHAKWFLGNSLGAILIASEDKKDIVALSEMLQKFCDDKRKEIEDLEKMAEDVDKIPTQEIPGISELLKGTGICLN